MLNRRIRWIILTLLFAAAPLSSLYAQGQKPPEQKKSDTQSPVKNARDSADQALDKVDEGVHDAASTVKDGANQALQSVDDTIHDRKK